MGVVGGIPVGRLDGYPQLAGSAVEPFFRPGVAGVGLQEIGFWGQPFVLRGNMNFLSRSLRDEFYVACAALRGQLIDYETDAGQTWNNFWVLHTRVAEEFETRGLYANYFGTVEFTLIPASTSY